MHDLVVGGTLNSSSLTHSLTALVQYRDRLCGSRVCVCVCLSVCVCVYMCVCVCVYVCFTKLIGLICFRHLFYLSRFRYFKYPFSVFQGTFNVSVDSENQRVASNNILIEGNVTWPFKLLMLYKSVSIENLTVLYTCN